MSEVLRVSVPSFDTLDANIPGVVEPLTRNERAVYYCLEAARGRICPGPSLYRAIYGLKPECDMPDETIIRVYISKLRQKIPNINIITHWGIGYSLEDVK